MTEVSSLTGRLLVATPVLADPNFDRAVVLLLDHDEAGSLGVVLNRPTPVDVGDILEPWAPLAGEPGVVFQGGPVSLDAALGVAVVPSRRTGRGDGDVGTGTDADAGADGEEESDGGGTARGGGARGGAADAGAGVAEGGSEPGGDVSGGTGSGAAAGTGAGAEAAAGTGAGSGSKAGSETGSGPGTEAGADAGSGAGDGTVEPDTGGAGDAAGSMEAMEAMEAVLDTDGPLGWRRVHGAIGLVDLEAPPELLAAELGSLRIFAGYAGWGPGQLEKELSEGAWYVVESEPGDVSSPDPERLWRSVLRRQRSELALVATYPDDPSLN